MANFISIDAMRIQFSRLNQGARGTAQRHRGTVARRPAPGGALGGAAGRATPSLLAGATMAAGNGGDLMDMPNDTFAMVLAAINQPQAAACMLATCQRVRAALRAPDAVPEATPEAAADAPMIVQIQAVSAALRLHDDFKFHRPGLELASACGWVQLFPLLARPAERRFIYAFAARGGHLALLQWARALATPPEWQRTCEWPAGRGHLPSLQWARAQTPPASWNLNTCVWAARGGHLALLQWARAQSPPAPWNVETCRAAAGGGHLALLQWARAQSPPAPWNVETCSAAAGGGHLALLQWARAQSPPAPWNWMTCQAAAIGGHLALLQ